MSSDMADDPFKDASEKVDGAHQEAITQLRAKVAEAKSEALKKISV